MIEIEVQEAIDASGVLGNHQDYLVKGKDLAGPFSTRRRFKEFEALRQCLVAFWPGVFIPSIPDKRIFKGEALTISKRNSYFNEFLLSLAQEPAFFYCEAMQIFLRSADPDVAAVLASFPRPHYSKAISKFPQILIQCCQRAGGQKEAQVVQLFVKTLGASLQLLKAKKTRAKQMAKARDQFNSQQASIFVFFFKAYENLFFKQGQGSVLEFGQFAKSFSDNPYWVFYVLFKSQLKDAEQAQRALQFGDYLRSKVQKYKGIIAANQAQIASLDRGSITLKSAFSTTPKAELIEKLHLDNQVQQKKIQQKERLLEVLLKVQCYFAIPYFRKRGLSRYSRALGGLALDRWPQWATFWEYTQLSIKAS